MPACLIKDTCCTGRSFILIQIKEIRVLVLLTELLQIINTLEYFCSSYKVGMEAVSKQRSGPEWVKIYLVWSTAQCHGFFTLVSRQKFHIGVTEQLKEAFSVHRCYLWPRSLWWLWPNLFSACFCLCRFTLFLAMNLISIVSLLIYFHLFFSPYPFTLPPGQQEDEEDARRGTAGKERAGEDCEESSEEHERPDLGRNKPLRFVSDTEGWD